MPHLEIPGGEDANDGGEESPVFDDPPEVDVEEVAEFVEELRDAPEMPHAPDS